MEQSNTHASSIERPLGIPEGSLAVFDTAEMRTYLQAKLDRLPEIEINDTSSPAETAAHAARQESRRALEHVMSGSEHTSPQDLYVLASLAGTDRRSKTTMIVPGMAQLVVPVNEAAGKVITAVREIVPSKKQHAAAVGKKAMEAAELIVDAEYRELPAVASTEVAVLQQEPGLIILDSPLGQEETIHIDPRKFPERDGPYLLQVHNDADAVRSALAKRGTFGRDNPQNIETACVALPAQSRKNYTVQQATVGQETIRTLRQARPVPANRVPVNTLTVVERTTARSHYGKPVSEGQITSVETVFNEEGLHLRIINTPVFGDNLSALEASSGSLQQRGGDFFHTKAYKTPEDLANALHARHGSPMLREQVCMLLGLPPNAYADAYAGGQFYGEEYDRREQAAAGVLAQRFINAFVLQQPREDSPLYRSGVNEQATPQFAAPQNAASVQSTKKPSRYNNSPSWFNF